MSRNTQYQFISTDTNALVSALVSGYEKITSVSVQPASPEKLFIQWVADIIIQERVQNNYTGNQNIPSRHPGKTWTPWGSCSMSQSGRRRSPPCATSGFIFPRPRPRPS